MATAVHRLTLEVRRSINPPEPEYQTGDWIIDPDIPDAPKRHWVSPISGGSIPLKPQAERDEADTEYLAAVKDGKFHELEQEFTDVLESIYPTGRQIWLTRAADEAGSNGLNDRLAYINSLWNWVKSGAGVLFAAQDLMESKGTEEEVEAVSLDLTEWLGTDPKVSIRAAEGIVT